MVVTVAALVSLGILATAGAGHLRGLASFHAALAAHRLWPPAVTLPLAGAVAILEVAIGSVGVASVALSLGTLQTFALAAAACLYGCYTVYGLYLLRSRPGVPCACSHDGDPVDTAVVVRAAVLAAFALAAVVNTPLADGMSALEATVVPMASLAYGLALWALPAALQDPFVTVGLAKRVGTG